MSDSAAWSLLAPASMRLVVVLVAVVVAAWQVRVIQRRRPPRLRRVIAVLVLIAALALLALRPARRLPAAATDRWLVTEGIQADALRAMTGEILILADAARALSISAAENRQIVPDASWVARHRSGTPLTVAGDGLDDWDWRALDSIAVEWVAGREPPLPGVDAVGWSRVAVVGSVWSVEGHVRGVGPGILRLRGPGGEVDEQPIEGDGPFALRALPRVPGRWQYQLTFEASEGSQQEPPTGVGSGSITETATGPSLATIGETVDLQVVEPRLPSVLWLEPSPRFETRHFKSWLTEQGAALAVRSAISRDRFRFERHNLVDTGLADLDLARLDAGLLSQFDIVVADRPYLAALSQRVLSDLRAAVADGLGLLLVPNSASAADRLQAPTAPSWLRFEIATVELGDQARAALGIETGSEPDPAPGAAGDDDRMPMRIAWGDGTVSTPLASSPRELLAADDLRPLIVGPAGRVLVGERRLGRGKVGASLVEETYRWVLEGNPEHHRRFWSRVLTSLARPLAQARMHPPVGPVRVDEPLVWTVDLPAAGAPPEALALAPDGTRRPLAWRQDVLRANRWQATVWPSELGWHGLKVGDEMAWLDVQPADAWPALRQAQRRLSTARHVLLADRVRNESPVGALGAPQPAARWVLFLLALAAAAGLWLDERLASPPASGS